MDRNEFDILTDIIYNAELCRKCRPFTKEEIPVADQNSGQNTEKKLLSQSYINEHEMMERERQEALAKIKIVCYYLSLYCYGNYEISEEGYPPK